MSRNGKGISIAFVIIFLWLACLVYLLNFRINFYNPVFYLLILVQMQLYTGLFITAHDAMHGTIAIGKPKTNFIIGQVCTALYAAFPFKNLNEKHHLHHQHVHSAGDPDYYEGNFFVWYFQFLKQYMTWYQLVIMAAVFNLLKIWVPQQNLVFFWVIPSLLSTFQLFYFGTYLPHKGEHTNKHQSTTQAKNHVAAFLSCYFFGYHYEHHDAPATPWWQLWKIKEKCITV